jgi:hypothetical protein
VFVRASSGVSNFGKGKVRKDMIRLAQEQLSANCNRFFILPCLAQGQRMVSPERGGQIQIYLWYSTVFNTQ